MQRGTLEKAEQAKFNDDVTLKATVSLWDLPRLL